MQNTLIQRIDDRLEELGISRAAAAKAAGFNVSFIRDIERRGGNPTLSSLKKLAKVLNVELEYLAGTIEENASLGRELRVQELPVIGTIEAGQFRDITIFDQDDNYPVINIVADERFRHAKQYALKVSGDSMNLKYPDGCYVACVDFIDSGLRLKTGMTVHIQRTLANTHLVEITLKEVGTMNGETVLIPRSSNPKHQPIIMSGSGESTEFQIRGVVIGSYMPEAF